VVVSIDEKSQIQALDRAQPGPPLKPGKCGTMTHDYKRQETVKSMGVEDAMASRKRVDPALHQVQNPPDS
jgi:hypothetical protein